MNRSNFSFFLIVFLVVQSGFLIPTQAQTIDTIPIPLNRDTVPEIMDTIPEAFPGDSIPIIPVDTVLRIKNLSPFFTMHVDSVINYKLEINKDPKEYYWFLRNAPVGLRVNKDNGMLTIRVDKNLFLSGKLKYDTEYEANIGVQNLNDPDERVDTSFKVLFYNTEIIPSRVKPTINSVMHIDENDTISFRLQCENGNFPIENITFFSNIPLRNYTPVTKCNDEFKWSPGYDFIKPTDTSKVKMLQLSFVGTNRFNVKDTAIVKIYVRDALNYPLIHQEYQLAVKNINTYVLQLKYTFLQLDKKVKKTSRTRTTFDITSSSTTLTGTVLSSSTDNSTQRTGKILPSVGVSLVPIKEAVAPQKVFDQNQATNIRSAIKRLEYMLQDNALVGEVDPDIVRKTNKLKDELKQIQVQLIDIPIDITSNMTEEELNDYFNSPKVNRKYRSRR